MVNDIIFCKSFDFNVFRFSDYKHTDNSAGIHVHYFAYMTRGHAKICTKRKTVPIRQGDVFYIPNGCQYRSYWYGDPEIEFISLGFRFMPNFQNRYYAPQVIETGEDDIQTMREIVACGILDSITVGKFYGLVGSLVQKMRNEHQTKQTALIEKVKDLLGLHPEYTVGDIAKACTVSESALYANVMLKKGVVK